MCVLFSSLINKIKPGIVKRVNRLPTPIAGLVSLLGFLSCLNVKEKVADNDRAAEHARCKSHSILLSLFMMLLRMNGSDTPLRFVAFVGSIKAVREAPSTLLVKA